jgi:MFS family permease
MACTGLAFPSVEPLAVVAIVAFVGTINPSTGDLGVLVPLEHAMLAQGVPDQGRTRTFARYSLIGALSMAAGSLAAAMPDFMTSAGFDRISAFRIMFYVYATLGLLCAAFYWLLPHERMDERRPSAPLGPSRKVVYKLAALFSLDAFAGGFVVQSLLALWLFIRFDMSLTAASVFFFLDKHLERIFLSSCCIALQTLWPRQHNGLYKHPLQHLPDRGSIFAEFNLGSSFAVGEGRTFANGRPYANLIRHGCSHPGERTAAASITAVPRSLASSLSPALAGVLLAMPFSGLPLVVCGVLKIAYDFALLVSFQHVKPPEEASL